jgi:hypothetical protein
VLHQRSEAKRISRRYRRILAPAHGDIRSVTEEVDVGSFESLAQLAKAAGRTVTHLPDPWAEADVYFVEDGGIRYRYRATGRARAARRMTV